MFELCSEELRKIFQVKERDGQWEHFGQKEPPVPGKMRKQSMYKNEYFIVAKDSGEAIEEKGVEEASCSQSCNVDVGAKRTLRTERDGGKVRVAQEIHESLDELGENWGREKVRNNIFLNIEMIQQF